LNILFYQADTPAGRKRITVKYDLVVVGGGPGGLTAAKVAAERGLKVLLLERRRDPDNITRACTALFYLRWVCPDGYLEPVSVEALPVGGCFHFPKLGYSVNYKGPLVPYTYVLWISPSGHKVGPYQNDLFAYYFDKGLLVKSLYEDARRAGVEIRLEASGMAAENTRTGVKVTVQGKGGKSEVIEASRAIAADSINSRIVESLGLNKSRPVFMPNVGSAQYVMEGVDTGFPEQGLGHLSWTVPSLEGGRFMTDARDGNKCLMGGDLEAIKADKRYAHWLANARILKKTAFAATVRMPLRNPVAGNVLVIGDAASSVETWVQGAIACGFQAARATANELSGRKGYEEYTAWWQQAFYCNDPGYFKRVVAHHVFTWDKMCTDKEVDYIFQALEGRKVVPTLAMALDPTVLKGRPELYKRVKTGLPAMLKEIAPLLKAYPPEATIYKDPDAYLKGWPEYRGY
jgi:flavin-dependent dehydrogenase